MRWTVEQVARAWDTSIPAGLDPRAGLAGVSIDSRTVGRGELFIAIHGPQHDGHRFVGAALDAGAVAAAVSRERLGEYPESIRPKLLGVADTLAALQDLARAVRHTWGQRLAAVTGSAGKTTTKEILAALLGTKLRVLKSEGNLNNEYGLPLALLQLEPEHQAAVVELGMSHRGELRRLAEIAEPQVGVVTCVAPVHLEFFASVDEIALAKRELIEGLAPAGTVKDAEGSGSAGGVAVLNADDPRVARFAEVAPGAVLTFGFGKDAQFRAENIINRGAEGSAFDFVSSAGRARLELPLPGRHNIANALAALAAASVWGLGAEAAQRAFPEILAGEMRGRLLRFEPGFAVINDSYNSNPAALQAMLEMLAHTPDYRRRILAAGEMLELGPASARLHREAGAAAAALHLAWIVAVQGHAAEIAAGAIDAGMPPERARFFATSAEAAAFVAEIVEPGDLLLVKGSRGVKMECLVEALRARYRLASQVPPGPAPDKVAPDDAAPDERAPDKVAPDKLALDKLASQSDPGRR
jgi:UDP-N-acetylmuramoyl-tripeptide--D-alanyl-D-alanine ligase